MGWEIPHQSSPPNIHPIQSEGRPIAVVGVININGASTMDVVAFTVILLETFTPEESPLHEEKETSLH